MGWYIRRVKLIYGIMFISTGVICWNLSLQFQLPDYKRNKAVFLTQIRDERDTSIPRDNENATMKIQTDKMQNSSSGFTKTQIWNKPSEKELEEALVLGSKKNSSGFLTIGIPTVQRETESYLDLTIDSLISNASPNQRSDVIILIFLADFEEEKRTKLKKMIKDKYLSYLESGLIQVIQAPRSFYPSLENLKSNYGDSADRVFWRSKQCVDFAFMFFYAEDLSEYYLQIEDDVFTTAGYIAAIRSYIQEQRKVKWVSLEFSTMGFIGKLFHAYDLDRLAQFIMFFYQDQPVDWLYRYFKDLNAQHKDYIRAPSIFQHRGKQSSLKGKDVNNWVDKTFIDNQPQYLDADNPPGTVYSNMTTYGKHFPQLSYNVTDGFFWAKKPEKGHVLTLVFDEPAVISRLAVVTGSSEHPADTLKEASVELGSVVIRTGSAAPECKDFVEVGRFLNGCIDLEEHERFASEVACLRIVVNESQQQWAIIKEIAVWKHH